MFKDIIEYLHHGWMVSVYNGNKGKHRENCLCHYPCKNFKPESEENCKIASELFVMCKKYGIVTPVWECSNFQLKDKSKF